MNLPQELSLIIMRELPASALLYLSDTCRYYAKLCNDKRLWIYKATQDFPQHYSCKSKIPPKQYYQRLQQMVKMLSIMDKSMFTPINIEYDASWFNDWIGLVYPSLPVYVYDEGKRDITDPSDRSTRLYRCRPDIEICNFSNGPVLHLEIRPDYMELLKGIVQATIDDVPISDRSFYTDSGAQVGVRGVQNILIYRHDLKEILIRARDCGFLGTELGYLKGGYVEKNKELFSVVP